jgi:starch synthase
MLFPDELKQAMRPGSDGMLLLREGILRAELVNTVSPGYAQEIVRPAFRHGAQQGAVRTGTPIRRHPQRPRHGGLEPGHRCGAAAPYSRADLAGKAACRRALLSELGFDPDDASPLLGMIGRLDPQKGFDLLAGAAPTLVEEGARLVVLGTGDPEAGGGSPGSGRGIARSVAVVEAFDRGLARRIYAGADMYLMPSRFEPCGQGQMIALRYGTPPIVHRTGGLADTVLDIDERPADGTGFVHDAATTKRSSMPAGAHEPLPSGGGDWAALQDRGMAIDWSWEAGPAEQYAASYRRAVSLRRENRRQL